MKNTEPTTARKSTKTKAKTEAVAEIETPTPTPSDALLATYEEIDANESLTQVERNRLTEEARNEVNSTLWKEHGNTMKELGKINSFDPMAICQLLPDGKYLGQVANFARQMAVALFDRCNAINAKELEGKAKKNAQNANLMARGFLMLHSHNQQVLTAISEAHREAGGESTGVKILANGDIDLRKSLTA